MNINEKFQTSVYFKRKINNEIKSFASFLEQGNGGYNSS